MPVLQSISISQYILNCESADGHFQQIEGHDMGPSPGIVDCESPIDSSTAAAAGRISESQRTENSCWLIRWKVPKYLFFCSAHISPPCFILIISVLNQAAKTVIEGQKD